MKKLSAMLLALLLAVCVVCAQADALHIGVMSGPTGMGMAQLMGLESDAYTFDVYSAPTDATADLASGALDLLCLPTNTAANLARAKADYVSVLAVNCLGTLYVVTDAETPVASIADLDGMTIWAGVPSSTTGPILNAIFEQNGVKVTIEWEADHDAVVARMLQGEIHAAVLPEPKVTAALTKAEGWNVALNVSAEWDKVFESRLPMGCIVARSSVIDADPAAVEQFLTDYAESIAFIADPANREESANMIAAAGVLPAAGIAKKALANLDGAIVYEDGEAMKADLLAFYGIIGQELPEDTFYYAK